MAWLLKRLICGFTGHQWFRVAWMNGPWGRNHQIDMFYYGPLPEFFKCRRCWKESVERKV